jgi:hypothetical protein
MLLVLTIVVVMLLVFAATSETIEGLLQGLFVRSPRDQKQ